MSYLQIRTTQSRDVRTIHRSSRRKWRRRVDEANCQRQSIKFSWCTWMYNCLHTKEIKHNQNNRLCTSHSYAHNNRRRCRRNETNESVVATSVFMWFCTVLAFVFVGLTIVLWILNAIALSSFVVSANVWLLVCGGINDTHTLTVRTFRFDHFKTWNIREKKINFLYF